MSIMELGALGEFLSSIGVIATLIYLAIQIKQNTRSVRAAAAQALGDRVGSVFATWIEKENSILLRKATTEPGSMTDDERFQFQLIMESSFLAMDSAYLAYRDNELPSELWNREFKALRGWLGNDEIMAVWENANVSDGFRKYVVEHMLRKQGTSITD